MWTIDDVVSEGGVRWGGQPVVDGRVLSSLTRGNQNQMVVASDRRKERGCNRTRDRFGWSRTRADIESKPTTYRLFVSHVS